MKYILDKKITFLYYIAVSLLLILFLMFYFNSQKVKSAGDRVDHTQEVLRQSDIILLDILNIETGARGYLISGNESFLEPFNSAKLVLSTHLKKMEFLIKDNPNQIKRVNILKQIANDRFFLSQQMVNQYKLNSLYESEKIAFIEKGKVITDRLRKEVAAINKEEFDLLKIRKSTNEKTNKNSEILLVLLLSITLIIFIIVIIITRNQKIRNYEFEAITASQKSLSQYSLSLIEASLDPLITISPEGKITDMNEAFSRVTGKSRSALLNTNFFDYFTEPEKARAVYQEVFKNGFVTDYPLTIKDGQFTDVLFNGSVYKDNNGNTLGAVVVARDITEQKIIQKELVQSKIFAEEATLFAEEALFNAEKATKIAEDSVKSKQQFLSNMSHEIRTPMNAIIGFTKVLLKTDLNAKQKQYLTAIKMSGDALIVLINDILDLAKVDAGKMSFEKMPFKLSLSISAMLHLFETKIKEKNLELIINYDKNIPEVLIGDPVRLHQIILNLVSNAVKFTTKGKITADVKLVNQNDDEVKISFAISDTGIGIKEDKIKSIFDNFQQATSGTSRLYGGTGLGLAIVKQLVDSQGGSVTVKSVLGEGSIFSFMLTFQKTTIETVLDTEILELDQEIHNIKVLVVEDMELNQLLMRTLLDDFGFDCDITSNGKLALEKLQTKTYDIILMDLQMPEMNGFEATEYIRKEMKLKIPIMALTADVTTVDLAKCKAVGMNDYVSKPIDERLLYSKIISLIKKPVVIIEKEVNKDGNVKTENIKYVDLTYLSRLTKANPVLMSEMIDVYLKQTPPLITTMKESLKNQDWHSLKAAAHKIIPSFAIIGLNSHFENLAIKIQEYASNMELSEEINELILKLESVCNSAYLELEIELNTLKNQNK